MGKTHDDEVYEKGVRDGQRGGFLEDLVEGNISHTSKDEKTYHKGYEYGATHRYGKEGRYHSWSSSGSKDPKTGDKKSGRSREKSTRAKPADGYDHDYKDRHYHGSDYDSSCETTCGAIGMAITCGFLAILLSPLVIGGIAGIKNYIENKKLQPKFTVAQKYNLKPHNLVDKARFGKTSLKELLNLDSEKIHSAKKNSTLSLQRKVNYGQLEIEIEDNLKELAGIMLDRGAERVEFKSYFQKGNNVWVVGKHSNTNGGFICYSPDKGETWFKQWKNEYYNDFPREIYLFDKNNGFSITTRRILHTSNGGKNWKTVHVFRDGNLRQLHILNRDTLVAQEEVIISRRERIKQGINGRPLEVPEIFLMNPKVQNQKKVPYKRTVYTENGGRTWKTIEDWNPRLFNLNNLSGIKLDKLDSIPNYISNSQKRMMEKEPKVYIY